MFLYVLPPLIYARRGWGDGVGGWRGGLGGAYMYVYPTTKGTNRYFQFDK